MVGSAGEDWSTLWIFSKWLEDMCFNKPHEVEAAKEIFKDTGIVISTEGKRYLGGAVGTSSFIRQYVERNACGISGE